MPAQRPLLPFLIVLYQTALQYPLGARARVFEQALNKEADSQGESPVPRPTRIIALRQATQLGVLRAEGEKGGRRYFPGNQDPGSWDDDQLAQRLQALTSGGQETDGTTEAGEKSKQEAGMTGKRGRKPRQVNATPKVTSGQTRSKKSAAPSTPLPFHAQQFKKLQAVVWGIADTLRDRSNLQVDAYRPITLLLLALKRNLDTAASMQQPGGWVREMMDENAVLLDTGVMTGADFANQVNQRTEIFDPAIFAANHVDHNKACAALMQWKDLVAFPSIEKNQRDSDQPLTMRLAANPQGKSWFTYTTYAGNQRALIEELVRLHIKDLQEAFSAIGLQAALEPADPNAPRLSLKILGDLVNSLDEVDMSTEAIPGDVFSDVYMDLLARFAEGSGKKGGDFFTPLPLVNGAIRLFPMDEIARELAANPDKQIIVGDPTAGAFTFLIAFWDALLAAAARQGVKPADRRQVIFHAQELTSIQAGLGVFNFFFHGLASRLALIGDVEEANGRSLSSGGAVGRIVGDTISEYTSKIGQQAGRIDYILTNPPYGTADYGINYSKKAAKGDQRWNVGAPTRSEGEWAFVNTIVDLLSPTGKAVIVLPLGVLFRDGGRAFRQYLVEKNWIEGIVALPSNQFLTTQIPVCMLLLNKDAERDFHGKPREHGVFFVNASDDFTKVGKFNHWDQDNAVEAWAGRIEKPGYSGFVPVEKLRDARNDYKLSVNRYFASAKEKEILDPVALAQSAATLRDRLSQRAAWLDGDPALGTPGLWSQAVEAAKQAAAAIEGVSLDTVAVDGGAGDPP